MSLDGGGAGGDGNNIKDGDDGNDTGRGGANPAARDHGCDVDPFRQRTGDTDDDDNGFDEDPDDTNPIWPRQPSR